jgi:hypothetical protein
VIHSRRLTMAGRSTAEMRVIRASMTTIKVSAHSLDRTSLWLTRFFLLGLYMKRIGSQTFGSYADILRLYRASHRSPLDGPALELYAVSLPSRTRFVWGTNRKM